MQWTKQNEQTVYANRWFSVNLADVELPDGRHLDHFLIRLRPVAVATVVNEANEVLLLWRHRFITDSWGLELAAGVVEDGEDIAVAAARELEEETGWRPVLLAILMSVEPSNGLTDARHHIFWADEGAYIGHPVDDFESDRREWVPLKLVPDMVARGEVPAANMAAALLLLHHLGSGRTRCPDPSPHGVLSVSAREPADTAPWRAPYGREGRDRGQWPAGVFEGDDPCAQVVELLGGLFGGD